MVKAALARLSLREIAMKHFCSGLSLAAALSAQVISLPATAADLSRPSAPVYTKAQPIVAAGYDWSGFYAGGHAGYDWGRAHVIDNGVLTENAVPMNGAIGGVLAGINWQSGSFVYGVEGDFGLSGLRGHGDAVPLPPPPPPPPSPPPPPVVLPPALPNQYDVNVSGNIRGRIGVAVVPTTLVYAAGGLAVAEFKFRENSGPIQNKELLIGWSIGGGIDQAFTKNLIGRIEYLYADYGHKDFTVVPGDVYNIGFKAQTVRGALMWKF
jgi:outer membrane immunogenic protein